MIEKLFITGMIVCVIISSIFLINRWYYEIEANKALIEINQRMKLKDLHE